MLKAKFGDDPLLNCSSILTHDAADNYMFKVNNRNPRTRYEICSKLIIKTPERRHGTYFTPCSSVSIVNFEM